MKNELIKKCKAVESLLDEDEMEFEDALKLHGVTKVEYMEWLQPIDFYEKFKHLKLTKKNS